MTEIQIPYLPTAQFFKIRCRLGVNEQDIIGDSDSDPQIRTIGGTVSISAMVPRFRYTEADGRTRLVYTKTETYNIQTSTGELFDADGNIGVNLLNTNSPQMDPQGWTYKATVRPNGGEPFDVPIPSDGGGEVFDLGDGLVFTPSTGITNLETRVKALEDSPSGGGGIDTEAVQDIVGAMVAAAGGTYDDAAGKITMPSGGATRGLIITDANVTTIPAGTTTDNLAAYYNSGAAAITVQGTSIAAGSHAVWAWVSGAWVLLASGTGTTTPPPGDVEVVATGPTWTDDTIDGGGTWTTPTQTGITYSPASGTATAGQSVTVTATAASGYVLTGPTSWSHTFPVVSDWMVRDSFETPGDLVGQTANPGGVWSRPLGVATITNTEGRGVLSGNNASYSAWLNASTSPSADYIVCGEVVPGNNTGEIGIIGRMVGNTWVGISVNRASNMMHIIQSINGAITVLGSRSAAITPNAKLRVYLTFTGTTVTAKVLRLGDGLWATAAGWAATDSSWSGTTSVTAAGGVGLLSANADGSAFVSIWAAPSDPDVGTGTLDAAAYRAAVTADAPGALWSLGESSGTVMTDSTGNARVGAYVSAYTLGSPSLLGDTDTAVEFGSYGTTTARATVDSANLAWLTGDFTVEFLMRPGNTAGAKGHAVIGRGTSWHVEIYNGALYLYAGVYGTMSRPLVVDALYHVVVRRSGTTYTLYVNGHALTSVTRADAPTGNLTVGWRSAVTAANYVGKLDEIAIYGSALSDTRIYAHANFAGVAL